MKRLRWIRLMAPALILAASVAACDVGQVTFNESRGSQLPKNALVVHAVVAEDNQALAQMLRWPGQSVPGARVLLTNMNTSGNGVLDTTVVITDSTGHVTVDDLSSRHLFRVSARRRLTPAEVERTRQQRPGLRAFGGGEKAKPGDTVEVVLEPNLREGIVLSEIGYTDPPVDLFTGSDYDVHGYLELYNNSAQTRYLDGMVIGQGLGFSMDFDAFPCRVMQPFVITPDGIWSRFFQAFPGGGQEYPIDPGETVVVATDAVDHSKVESFFLDLRDADFEFQGPAEGDNPSVPNMEPIGLEPAPGGHGLGIQTLLTEPIFLSDPVVVSELRRGRPPRIEDPYVLFPAARIIDAMGYLAPSAEQCAEFLHDRFDRLGATYTSNESTFRLVLQRRRIGAVGETPVLMDTNASEADFYFAPRSPGRLPPVSR